MAGKWHKDFERYSESGGEGGGQTLHGGRRTSAYAEGYTAYRDRGLTRADNPHSYYDDDNSTYWSWDQGWRDAESGHPSTHVGGPDAVPPPPPEVKKGKHK